MYMEGHTVVQTKHFFVFTKSLSSSWFYYSCNYCWLTH